RKRRGGRVGQELDYDKLTLTIETDGTVTPEDALGYAARRLSSQPSLRFSAVPRTAAHCAPPGPVRAAPLGRPFCFTRRGDDAKGEALPAMRSHHGEDCSVGGRALWRLVLRRHGRNMGTP